MHNKIWFVFQKDKLFLKNQNLLTEQDSRPLKNSFLREFHLGTYNDSECYTAEIDTLPATSEELIPLRAACELLGETWFHVMTKAIAVINWDRNHLFCGHCRTPTIAKENAYERTCPNCHLSVYPRISPSIIVRIRNEDKILMARSPHFRPGMYGLIAGFVDISESIEDAIHREVKEEVNLEVKNLKYFGSQAWPFPDSLMIAFSADYAGGKLQIDNQEIEDANWYSVDELPGRLGSKISISRRLVDDFILQMQTKR